MLQDAEKTKERNERIKAAVAERSASFVPFVLSTDSALGAACELFPQAGVRFRQEARALRYAQLTPASSVDLVYNLVLHLLAAADLDRSDCDE